MTDIRNSGLIRETLAARTDPSMRVTGLVREVLRSTGTSGATYMAVDGLVREVLMSVADATSSQVRAMILA